MYCVQSMYNMYSCATYREKQAIFVSKTPKVDHGPPLQNEGGPHLLDVGTVLGADHEAGLVLVEPHPLVVVELTFLDSC